MMQITASGPVDDGNADLAALKEHYQDNDFARLPGFLAPDFLREIQAELRAAPFIHKVHRGIGEELVCWDSKSGDKLQFVMNDPRLFAWINQITGCGYIGCFLGRIYRMSPGKAHHDSWHSDVGGHRLVAVSVNLSEEPYNGGTLILREGGRPETERRLPNVVPGDAVMFRLDPSLEHWISDVEPGPDKTAWAGWFRSEPTFLEVISGKKKF